MGFFNRKKSILNVVFTSCLDGSMFHRSRNKNLEQFSNAPPVKRGLIKRLLCFGTIIAPFPSDIKGKEIDNRYRKMCIFVRCTHIIYTFFFLFQKDCVKAYRLFISLFIKILNILEKSRVHHQLNSQNSVRT